MSSPPKSPPKSPLPGGDVSALMDQLSDVGKLAREVPRVRPFTLGQEDFKPTAWMPGLERIGEKLARRMRTVVEPLVEGRTKITAETIETVRYEAWRGGLPDFTSLNFYRMRPLKGGMLVVVEPDFVAGVVDMFFGGTGLPAPRRHPEFTPSEDALIVRLTDAVVRALSDSWAEIIPLTPSLVSRETNAVFANLFRAEETVVIQRFSIVPGQGRPTVISIVYPLGSLRAVEGPLTAKVHDDSGPADAQWRSRIAVALDDVRLPVRSVLARPKITAAQLMALKPGDVIPISVGAKIPLLVANRRFAYGTIGEKDGHAALLIDTIEKGQIQ